MKKICTVIFIVFLNFNIVYASSIINKDYNCVLTLFDGSDHPSIKFPLKIKKRYDDNYVVYSHGNIIRNEILVFGKLYANELIGFLYDDSHIQLEIFNFNDETLTFYLINISKEKNFPFSPEKSKFIAQGLNSLTGTEQKLNISYNINEDELNLEKKIFEFNNNFVDNLSNNKNLEVEDFIHNCKKI